MSDRLRSLVEAELRRPVPPPLAAMAAHLAERGGDSTLAVLFYGAAQRSGDIEALLDFYVLVERLDGWHAKRLPALANRLLPPNVEYHEVARDGHQLRAKVAVLTLAQFQRLTAPKTLDTTIWARFSQPARLVWARDTAAVTAAVAGAVTTAALWAAVLGPRRGPPLAFWQALYERTYAAELRVESSGRSAELVAAAAERYVALLPEGWAASGIAFETDPDGQLAPLLDAARRRRLVRAWRRRALLGKPLNLLRLGKAAFTFSGGGNYIIGKIARHSGTQLTLSDWQSRHLILSAPGILWRLWRRGVLK